MVNEELELKFTQTIEQLSDPASYNMVCHEHRLGEPLPSIFKLQKIVELLRGGGGGGGGKFYSRVILAILLYAQTQPGIIWVFMLMNSMSC